jgi:hypothetical protein
MLTQIQESELAWFAGVIDAIGRISTRRTKTCILPTLAVSCSEIALMEKLSAMSGVKYVITKRDYSAAGCNQHCKTKHKHVVSVSCRWLVTGARATVIMKGIEPYITIKCQDISQGIALGDTVYAKDATVKKMQALGWAA